MCYSPESSLSTFLVGSTSSLYLLLLLIIGLAHNLYKKFSDTRNYCSKPNKDGALAWAYMEEHDFSSISTMLYYIIFLIAPFMLHL